MLETKFWPCCANAASYPAKVGLHGNQVAVAAPDVACRLVLTIQ